MKKYIIVLFILILSHILFSAGTYHSGGPLNPPATTYKTANISSPIPFADWWTSVITKQNSEVLVAFPLSFKVLNSGGEAYGLAVWYPRIGQFNDNGNLDTVTTGINPEIYIRALGWNQANLTTRVDGYSDWSVKIKIDDGTSIINYITLVKGSPFFYIESVNCSGEEIYFTSPITKTSTTNLVDANLSTSHPVTNDYLMFYTGGKHYAVFSFPGTVFKMINVNKVEISNFSNYLAVAIVSNEKDLSVLYQSAYAYISDTKISYSYNELTSKLDIDYNITTTLKRNGFTDEPLICLFPHHYKHSTAATLSIIYPTIRGILKLFKGKSFTTVLKFNGILPFFTEPFDSGYSRTTLQGYINTMKSALQANGFARGDTYFSGKSLARAAALIPIANEIGDYTSRDYFINTLRTELSEWFTAGGDLYFCYFNTWGTMLGYPTGFGADTELNDHHFHYGYFIYSSAILSMFNTTFISDYGNMVDHLIRDVNSPNRSDSMYAFLNYLDIYEGHSWASGVAPFNDGNNQESSSEAMNFWVGVYLWGLITDNNTYRDLGIFGYVLENSAIDEYWFDKDKSNLHQDYLAQNSMVALVWGGKYEHKTWFSSEQEAIYGIQWIPVTPSALYLAYQPGYAENTYNEMTAKNGGTEDGWYDVIWKYQSFFDATAAISKFNANPGLITGVDFDKSAGNSTAEVYNFIHNMKSLGRIDTNYYADSPAYNVFTNNNGTSNDITYMAYNSSSSFRTVKFYKDGSLKYSLSNIPPHKIWSSKSVSPTNWAPLANFFISNVSSLKKFFCATNSFDIEGDTIYYAWDIDGDNNIDIGFNINNVIITNIYSTYGTNYVTLWVTDMNGTNSKTLICYRPGPDGDGDVVSESKNLETKMLVSQGTNVNNSIPFPNPVSLSRDNEVKFGIYEDDILKGFPVSTIVYIYDITGNLIWKSNPAEDYKYNIIAAYTSVFRNSNIQNEVVICVIKNGYKKFVFKLLILK